MSRESRSSIVNGIDLSCHFGLVRTAVRTAVRRCGWALGAALDEGDLFQAGFFALRRAAELFEPERGFAFSTYALPSIRHHVLRLIGNERRVVRLPVWVQTQARNQGARLPLDALSLDAPARTGDPDSSWLDMLAAGEGDPSAEAEAVQRREVVAAALAELPERLRAVLVARFWGERTLQQVGTELGVTRERIRQIEADALERLRSSLKDIREEASTKEAQP